VRVHARGGPLVGPALIDLDRLLVLRTIDERRDAARAAGRAPHAIRRAYNLAGVVLEPGEAPMAPRRPGMIIGLAEQWAEELANYYRQLGMDTFIFWPAIRDHERQTRRFAERVIPAARQAIGSRPS